MAAPCVYSSVRWVSEEALVSYLVRTYIYSTATIQRRQVLLPHFQCKLLQINGVPTVGRGTIGTLESHARVLTGLVGTWFVYGPMFTADFLACCSPRVYV